MNLFKRKPDGFYRGLGAEFAFQSKDGVVVISGGEIIRIGLESGPEGSNTARIVLDRDDVDKVVLDEGDIRTVAARYDLITAKALSPRQSVSVPRKGVYAFLAAFTALTLLFGLQGGALSDLTDPETAQVTHELGKLFGGVTPPTSIPALANPLAASVPPSIATTAAVAPVGEESKSSPIFDKPSFLALDDDKGDAKTKDVKEADGDASQKGIEDKAAAAEPIVPSYVEGMYEKQIAEAQKARADYERATAGLRAKAASAPLNTAQTDSGGETPKAAQVDPTEKVKVEAPAAVSVKPAPAEAPTAQEHIASSPAATSSDKAVPDEKVQKLSAGLVSKGMSEAKAVEVAAQLEQLSALGGKDGITPEMLAQLPHEVAQLLKENGLLANMEKPVREAGVPYAIIRLPEAVIDSYRGKDGIAAIPLNDSYAALGNKVSIPLPGGGDIKGVEDLEAFGFKP